MTPEELQAIQARCAAATPGPWHWTYDGSSDWSVFIHDFEGGEADRIASVYRYHATECPDVEFIAHARSDVPALLTEVERLKGLVESLRAFANHFEDCSCWLGDVQLADRPCDCGLRDIDNALEERMTDRWSVLVERAYKEAFDRALRDVREADKNTYDLDHLWKKSDSRKMLKAMLKEGK